MASKHLFGRSVWRVLSPHAMSRATRVRRMVAGRRNRFRCLEASPSPAPPARLVCGVVRVQNRGERTQSYAYFLSTAFITRRQPAPSKGVNLSTCVLTVLTCKPHYLRCAASAISGGCPLHGFLHQEGPANPSGRNDTRQRPTSSFRFHLRSPIRLKSGMSYPQRLEDVRDESASPPIPPQRIVCH